MELARQDVTCTKLPANQKLIHSRYWDFLFNDYNYSYINVATDQYKYCTLSFDRLGIGNSSHGEPLNEIQSFIEIAATVQLTQMLRNSTFVSSFVAGGNFQQANLNQPLPFSNFTGIYI
jgi:hypothetical protein